MPDKPAPDAIPVPGRPETPPTPPPDFPEIPKPQEPVTPYPVHPEPAPTPEPPMRPSTEPPNPKGLTSAGRHTALPAPRRLLSESAAPTNSASRGDRSHCAGWNSPSTSIQ
jgi:hypothetical protein